MRVLIPLLMAVGVTGAAIIGVVGEDAAAPSAASKADESASRGPAGVEQKKARPDAGARDGKTRVTGSKAAAPSAASKADERASRGRAGVEQQKARPDTGARDGKTRVTRSESSDEP